MAKLNSFSQVEQIFFDRSERPNPSTALPYIIAENFPKLGLFAALRFLEWVHENPDGVISLPTGKTPEYFIKWVTHLAANWSDKSLTSLRHEHGLPLKQLPTSGKSNFACIFENAGFTCGQVYVSRAVRAGAGVV